MRRSGAGGGFYTKSRAGLSSAYVPKGFIKIFRSLHWAQVPPMKRLGPRGGRGQPKRFGSFVNSICNNVLLEYYRSLRKNQQMDDTHEETSHLTRLM